MKGLTARAMKTLVITILPAILLTTSLFAQVADGDRHYASRAEGADGNRAASEQIDAAIAAYQHAIIENSNDVEAHWKLLRAYRFKGAYVVTTSEEKKKVYSAAKSAGERALTLVGHLLAARGVKPAGPEKDVAEAAHAIAGAAEVYLWDSVNWGEWALAYGKLAAARQGAADRIRREATIAMLIDPTLEGGAPSRVLGRLHDQTPRIPFFTGWASEKEALRFLRESQKIDPTNKLTLVFLAEAMVSNDSQTKPQAIQLLRGTIAAPLHPDFVVEDADAIAQAKGLLAKWGA
jgi:tetratricopeptide (TPR) repeat protein